MSSFRFFGCSFGRTDFLRLEFVRESRAPLFGVRFATMALFMLIAALPSHKVDCTRGCYLSSTPRQQTLLKNFEDSTPERSRDESSWINIVLSIWVIVSPFVQRLILQRRSGTTSS